MGKLVIAGGRDFNDYNLMLQEVKRFCDQYEETQDTLTIISGCAKGADHLGEQLAKNSGIPLELYPADWDNHGKSAGYKRNCQMAEVADAVICFWDGKSLGTKHMIDIAFKSKLPLRVVGY